MKSNSKQSKSNSKTPLFNQICKEKTAEIVEISTVIELVEHTGIEVGKNALKPSDCKRKEDTPSNLYSKSVFKPNGFQLLPSLTVDPLKVVFLQILAISEELYF